MSEREGRTAKKYRGPLYSGEEEETEEEILRGWKKTRVKVERELMGSRINYDADDDDDEI